MTPKVAVIGAGPGGAIALDTFLKNGYDVKVFERRRTVGGTWNLDDRLGFKPTESVPGWQSDERDSPVPIPADAESATASHPAVKAVSDFGARYDESPLYSQVETNVLAEMMAFKEKPFPAVHPPKTKERFGREDAFRLHGVVRDYVDSFFQGREQHLVLNTSVEKAYQVAGPGSKWRLVFRRHEVDDDKEEWWTEDFDFLYAASGRFNVPFVPSIPGLKEAIKHAEPGTIIHTKVFRDPELYRGKKVVLVGASFSNVDIVHLIHAAGSAVPLHLSLLTVLPTSVRGFLQPWIEAHPAITKVSLQNSSSNKLDIEFEDGSTVSDVDALIFGTGYKYSYPYLEEYLKPFGGIVLPSGKGSTNLFWSTWWKYDASLVVTSSITDSLFWRLLEAQAKASAALWKRDRSTWPTVEESDKWESARRELNLFDFHIWYPHYDQILDGLAEASGISFGEYPDYNNLFLTSFDLKGKLWEAEGLEYLEKHPEDKERYEQTKKFLADRTISL